MSSSSANRDGVVLDPHRFSAAGRALTARLNVANFANPVNDGWQL